MSGIFRGPSALDERRLLGSTPFLFNFSLVTNKGKGCIGKAANTSHSNLPKIRTLYGLLARSCNFSLPSDSLTSDSTATFENYDLCGGVSPTNNYSHCEGTALSSKVRQYSTDQTRFPVKQDGAATRRSFFHTACFARAPSSKYIVTSEEVTYRPQTGVFLPSPSDRSLCIVADALQDLQERNDHLLSPDIVFHARKAVSAARMSALAFYAAAEPEVVKTIQFALTEQEPFEGGEVMERRLHVAREFSEFLGEHIMIKLSSSFYDSDD